MGKYDAWEELFRDLSGDQVEFDFESLASCVQGGLPESAYRYAEWWSNANYYAVWTRYGWYVSPDMHRRVARFSRIKPKRGRPAGASSVSTNPASAVVGSFASGKRLVLIGCVSSKRSHAAPARDLYVSDLWLKRREYAESTGMPWAILSAEHGLLDPDTVIEPYDRFLGRQTPAYQRQWAAATGVAVVGVCRELGVSQVEAHAGKAYLETGLIQALNRERIHVYWPLRGMRIGEQLGWYSSHFSIDPKRSSTIAEPEQPTDLRDRIAALEAELADLRHQSGLSDSRVLSVQRKQVIANRILEHGQSAAPPLRGEETLVFTPNREADQLVRSDPFAFLLGVIFDQGIIAERAWEAPWHLQQRLGHLDPEHIARSPEEVRRAIAAPPSLHRYVENVPRWVVLAADKVVRDYGGEASAIWFDSPTVKELRRRLEDFKGIGVKKSAMAIEMLERDFGVSIREIHASDIAYDVHIRRVFIRTGIAERDEIGHMTAIARQIHPDRPGKLDLPTWLIGREWCHPRNPNCAACVLDDVCEHRITAGDAVKGG